VPLGTLFAFIKLSADCLANAKLSAEFPAIVSVAKRIVTMNKVTEFTPDESQKVASLIAWKHSDTVRNPDVESAILLRSLVLPAFEAATGWHDLVDALDSIGFGLSIRGGRLSLIDGLNGERICTGRFLGMPLADLTKRFGKPVVIAKGEGDGEFQF